MKKWWLILVVIIIIISLFFIIPWLYHVSTYNSLKAQSFDSSAIRSISEKNNFNGVLIEELSLFGKGEIFLLKNNDKKTKLFSQKVSYGKSQDPFGCDKIDTYKGFLEDSKWNDGISGDKNYIFNAWRECSKTLPIFIDISQYVEDPKNPIWDALKIGKPYLTERAFQEFRYRLSPNGQYLMHLKIIDNTTWPWASKWVISKVNADYEMELEKIKKEKTAPAGSPPISQLKLILDPSALDPLFSTELWDLSGQMLSQSLADIVWTEDGKYVLFRGGVNLWSKEIQTGKFEKITSNFPSLMVIKTAFTPNELIANYYGGWDKTGKFITVSNKEAGTYLIKLNNDKIEQTKLLPSTVKFIGFVH